MVLFYFNRWAKGSNKKISFLGGLAMERISTVKKNSEKTNGKHLLAAKK